MKTKLKYTIKKYISDAQFRLIRYAVYTLSVGRQFALPRKKATCNICNYSGAFRPFGHPPRYGAECVGCGSVERHRLLKLWWDQNLEFVKRARTLHFAPELGVQQFVTPTVREYHSADIEPGRAELVLNIERIQASDESYDLIICVHVLEHVNDKIAMSELYRVLTGEGILIIMVPIVEGWKSTYENPSIVDARDRLYHYGQKNHVRIYGRDLRDRLTAAGFQLEEITAAPPLMLEHSLLPGETVFVCRKCPVETR